MLEILDIIKYTYSVSYTGVFRICGTVYVKRSEVPAGSTVQHWGRCPLAGSVSPGARAPKGSIRDKQGGGKSYFKV